MSRSNSAHTALYLFPPLGWWRMINGRSSQIDLGENWVKQSLRSRYDLVGPNGPISLSVPTIKSTRGRLVDVEISYVQDWVTQHIRSVRTAYNRSPFYDFYGPEYEALLESRPTTLVDLNRSALSWLMKRLEISGELDFSETYLGEHDNWQQSSDAYHQVFDQRHGFIARLSALDTLFNLGPEASQLINHAPA